jgi:hypothetical protein
MSSPDATGQSLSELILADDGDAIAGFRDAHIHKVRAYCEEACPSELVDEARDAAYVDFLGRLRLSAGGEVDLEETLLKATRSAAAGRMEVQVPPGESANARESHTPDPTCEAMPELLAALANHELKWEAQLAVGHLEGCPTCATTAARIARAAQRYIEANQWDDLADARADNDAPAGAQPEAGGAHERVLREVGPRPDVTPEAEAGPGAEPTPAVAQPPATRAVRVVKVRRGGIVGMARRLVDRPGTATPRRR